jgi:Beta-propeller repeat
MARRGILLLSVCWLSGSCGALWAATPPAPPQMPFAFVTNVGQADSRVRAIGTGPKFKAWFEEGSVLLQQGAATMRIGFVGANPQPAITMADPIGATANYLRGSDPQHWQTNVPIFGAVQYEGVWPGVAMAFRQDGAGVKAEYTLAAGADIGEIRLLFDGDSSIAADGSLIVRTATGEFHEARPVFYQDIAYQDIGSVRTMVSGGFVKTVDGMIAFAGDYNHADPLVIDPSIQFSGYFGGTGQDNITAVAVNSTFNVIAAGWSLSMDLPASNGVQTSNRGGVDAFVASFSPIGGQLVWCTYLGGSGDDRAFGVAVDASNNTYVTGWSSSVNFPVVGGVQSRLSGARDAFVAKLNPAGNALIYSTYLGGTGVDYANAIAVDSLGEAVIVGDTTSTNLPVTAGVFQRTLAGGQDVFVARLAANGGSLSFLTYFGGNSTDHGTAVEIDPTGPIVIGGGTNSTNLPVLLAYQAHSGGGQDGFVTKFNSTATALVLSTYLGGSGGSPGFPEEVNGLVIGPSRNIVAAGVTSSTNFPTTSASFQPVYGGGQTDGFLSKLNGTTGALMASTFLGGTLNDGINAITGDLLGRLYVTGFTISVDFPVARSTQGASAGGAAGSMDAFIATLNSGLSLMPFGTYLGGSGSDSGNAIAVDAMTSIVVAGETTSPDFPSSGSLASIPAEVVSSFVTKLAPDWTLEVATTPAVTPIVTIDTWHTAGYNGSVPTSSVFSYGQAGDIPVAGDWTGSGVKRIGIFRNGLWILDTNNNGILDAGDKIVSFGQAGDIPIPGDWTGSGTVKLGLYRAGSFILDLSGHLSGISTGVPDATFAYGLSTDIPVVGDWNATGFAKVGVFRNGSWLIDYTGTHVATKTYTYGQAGDIPVTGNWDSAGLIRIGVYRAGSWILNFSGTNALGVLGQTDLNIGFGAPGQTPVVH